MPIGVFKRLTSRYTAASSLTRAITSDDPQGATARDLHEVSLLATRPRSRDEVFNVLESRLKSGSRHWRGIGKTLRLIKYLVIQGSGSAEQWVRDHRALIERLTTFKSIGTRDTDHGRAVREWSSELLVLLDQPAKLQTEREAYQRARSEVRASIGRQTSSRHTLEFVRGLDDDFVGDVMSPVESGAPRHSLSLPLDAIEEEQAELGLRDRL